MEIEELLKDIGKLNFNQIVKRETILYIDSNIRSRKESKKIITDGQKLFTNKEDKIIYNLESINYLNIKVEEENSRIRYDFISNYEKKVKRNDFKFDIYEQQQYHQYKEFESQKLYYQSMIFYAVRALQNLGISGLEQNAFSNNEVIELNKKIDAILDKLNNIQFGQQILFDTVEDIKTDFISFKTDYPLGKRKWYQRTSGAIISYVGTKATDEIFELIKPELKDFFMHHAIPVITKLLT
ncbi:MAG: hypothetical protein ABI367_05230 [Mucilaginibacter sp.]